LRHSSWAAVPSKTCGSVPSKGVDLPIRSHDPNLVVATVRNVDGSLTIDGNIVRGKQLPFNCGTPIASRARDAVAYNRRDDVVLARLSEDDASPVRLQDAKCGEKNLQKSH